MIVAVTHRRDEHARPVLDALARQGVDAVLLDLASLPARGRVALAYGGGGCRELRVLGSLPIDVARVRALWWRRPQPLRPPRSLPAARADFAIRQMADAVMGVVSSLEGAALVVNNPWREDAAAQKTFHLAAAERVGLRIPTTLVTSEPRAAREFVRAQGGAGAVHKALHCTPEDWRRTCRLGPRGLAAVPDLRHAPVILQEHIPGVDVRVTIVGDQIFAAEIDARRSSSPDDYRGFERQCRIAPCGLPPRIDQGLRELMRNLGLAYGASDFRRRADGEWFFLELNPSGQWLFIEERTGQPITAAVAALLAGGPRGSRRSGPARPRAG